MILILILVVVSGFGLPFLCSNIKGAFWNTLIFVSWILGIIYAFQVL